MTFLMRFASEAGKRAAPMGGRSSRDSRPRRQQVFTLLAACLLAAGNAALSPSASAGEVGTAFTYQGRLRQAGIAVDDLCDVEFRLFNALAGGTQIGPTLTFDGSGPNPVIDVVEGLFTVQLDFGVGVFEGDARFLEIAVRCPPGSGSYSVLAPRQPVSAAPYALYALDSPASFNLPLMATIDRPETAFDITNAGGGALAGTTGQTNAVAIYGTHTGSGRAGLFENLNAASIANVLEAFTLSAGDAFVAVTNGAGRAARFELANTASTAPAVEAVSDGINAAILVGAIGMGDAGEFEIRNPASGAKALRALSNGSGSAVFGTNIGTGSAANFGITNAASGADALVASTNGGGAAVLATSNGMGAAGDFAITNAGSAADALVATTNGSGAGVSSTNTGTGPAGEFIVPAPGNNVPAIVGWQFGNAQAASFISGAGMPISQATVSALNFRLTEYAGEFSNVDPNNVDPALFVENNGLGLGGVFRSAISGAGWFFSAVDPNQLPGTDPTLYAQNSRATQAVAEFHQSDPNNNSPAVVVRRAGDDDYALDVASEGGLARFVSTTFFFSEDTEHGVEIDARTLQSALHVQNSSADGKLALFEQTAPTGTADAVVVDVETGGCALQVEQTGAGGAACFRRSYRLDPEDPPLPPLEAVVEIIRDPNAFLDGQPALRVQGGVEIQTAEPVGLKITHQGGQALNVTASLGSPIGLMTGDSDNVPALRLTNTGTQEVLHIQGNAENAPSLSVFGNVEFIGDEFTCSSSVHFSESLGVGPGAPFTGAELSVCGDAAVDGEVRADAFAQTDVTACDYVFEPDYPLMPLDELRAFLAREKHLPNVPSEAEIAAAGGIDLGDFQMRLLEKIEELTLYTLQQDEQLAEQDRRLREQDEQLREQGERLRRHENENADLHARLAAIEAALAVSTVPSVIQEERQR